MAISKDFFLLEALADLGRVIKARLFAVGFLFLDVLWRDDVLDTRNLVILFFGTVIEIR